MRRLADGRIVLVTLALAVGGAWLAPPVSEPFGQVLGVVEGHNLANPPTTQLPELMPPVTLITTTAPTVTAPSTTGTLPASPTTPTVPLASPPPAPPTGTTSAAQPPPPPPPPVPEPSAEAALHQATEQLRLEAGLQPLEPDPGLHLYARQWAARMAEGDQLEHSDIGQLLDGWTTVGENIGSGSDAGAIFDALAASPSHRAIMLTPTYTAEGIGVALDADGVLWTCHVFAGDGPVVTLPVPTIPLPTLPLP